MMPHAHVVMDKQVRNELNRWTTRSVENQLTCWTQRVVSNGLKFNWQLVTTGVRQGGYWVQYYSISLEMILVTRVTAPSPCLWVDIKAEGKRDKPERRATTLKHINRLEDWDRKICRRFNEDKCEILHPE